MATGAEAIEVVARVTGILPATVGRAARALREAGQDFWPQAAPGGGKNARHVRPHHLVNLAVALAIADPLTDAPEQSLAFRNLVQAPASRGLLWGTVQLDTLGGFMDGLVHRLSLDDGFSTSDREHFRHATHGMKLSLRTSRAKAVAPFALLHLAQPGDNERQIYYFSPADRPVRLIKDMPDASLCISSRVPFELFEALGNLWADTQAHEQAKACSTHADVSQSVSTTNENGAPGRAPRTRIQDHGLAAPAGDTPEDTRERESSQVSLSRGPGPSPNRHRKDFRHGRTIDPAAGPGG